MGIFPASLLFFLSRYKEKFTNKIILVNKIFNMFVPVSNAMSKLFFNLTFKKIQMLKTFQPITTKQNATNN